MNCKQSFRCRETLLPNIIFADTQKECIYKTSLKGIYNMQTIKERIMKNKYLIISIAIFVVSIIVIIGYVIKSSNQIGLESSMVKEPVENSTETLLTDDNTIEETVLTTSKLTTKTANEKSNSKSGSSNNDNTKTQNNEQHTSNEQLVSNNNYNISISKKNALEKAKSYLSHSAYSRESLINQLEFEQYSNEDAVYAVDNVGADWNEQAVKKARSYLSHSAYSREGLINQLEFEGFTHDQAEYGVNNISVDWNEQAVKKARSYLSHSAYSREGLINQLEFEGFTHEQSVYGVTQNGL